MEGEKERTCDGDGKKGRKTEWMGKGRRLKGGGERGKETKQTGRRREGRGGSTGQGRKKKNRTGREQRGEMKGVCKNKSVSKFQLDWVCNVISLKQKSTEMPKFKLFGKLYRGP